MAFPSIRASISGTGDTVGGTSHTITLPSGIQSGDLIIVWCSTGNSAATHTFGTEAGTLTKLYEIDDNNLVACCAYKIAGGSESSITITVTTAATGRTNYYAVAVQDWHGSTLPAYATADHGATSNATHSAPNLSPSWGAEDTLWFAVSHIDAAVSVSAWPSAYTNTGSQMGTASAGGGVAWGSRQLNAASEDPGNFVTDISSGRTSATIAVRPAGGGSVAPIVAYYQSLQD